MSRNSGDFSDGASKSQQAPLTDHQKAVLDFGRRTFSNIGHRENEIRSTFDMSSTSYFQQLRGLLSHPEAVEYAPEVVRTANEIIADKRPGRGGGYMGPRAR